MSEQDWGTSYTRAIQLMVAGLGLDTTDEDGTAIVDDDMLLLINGGHESLDFDMPGLEGEAANWELLLDTNDDGATESVHTRGKTHLEARSLRLFRGQLEAGQWARDDLHIHSGLPGGAPGAQGIWPVQRVGHPS